MTEKDYQEFYDVWMSVCDTPHSRYLIKSNTIQYTKSIHSPRQLIEHNSIAWQREGKVMMRERVDEFDQKRDE